MMVKKEKLFLRNKALECNPNNQKQTSFYQRVKSAIQRENKIINPLICVKEGDKYKVCVGNNRYLAGLELGFTKFPVILTESEEPKVLKEMIAKYQDVEF